MNRRGFISSMVGAAVGFLASPLAVARVARRAPRFFLTDELLKDAVIQPGLSGGFLVPPEFVPFVERPLVFADLREGEPKNGWRTWRVIRLRTIDGREIVRTIEARS